MTAIKAMLAGIVNVLNIPNAKLRVIAFLLLRKRMLAAAAFVKSLPYLFGAFGATYVAIEISAHPNEMKFVVFARGALAGMSYVFWLFCWRGDYKLYKMRVRKK